MPDRKEEKILSYNFASNQIYETRKCDTNDDEINVFKEFIKKLLADDEEKLNNFKVYSIAHSCSILNKNDDKGDCEFDFYFINKDLKKNKEFIFLIEIKDLSQCSLNMLSYTNYKIANENIRLVNAFFPMYNSEYNFIKIDVVKTTDNNIQYAIYQYNPSFKSTTDINNFHHDKNWKVLSKEKLLKILRNTQNIDLYEENLEFLKRDSYNKQYIKNLLNNYNDSNLIRKTVISIDNIKQLKNVKLNEKKLIIINGVPGSGKTVFAALLFITERNVAWIVTNKFFFQEHKDLASNLQTKLGNQLLLFKSTKFNPEFDLKNFNIVVIDEYQNIKNSDLIKIIKYCYEQDIKVFLLGDYNQNIYYWLNVKRGKLDKNDAKLKKSINKIYDNKNLICQLDWEKSNRFSDKDINRLQKLIFNDSKLSEWDETFLQIDYCQPSTINKIKEIYKDDVPILEINGSNLPGHLIQYQFIGNEYDNVIIFLSSKFLFHRNKLKICFYDNINKKLTKETKYTLLTWLYVAFTRATKSIKIFVDEENENKKQICDYFNKKLKELGYQ